MSNAQLAPVITWRSLIAESDLPPTTRHVALALSLYMNEKGGSAFPGAERLARDTSLTDRAVRENLKILVERGYLRVLNPGGGRGNAKVFAAANPESDDAKPGIPTQQTLNEVQASSPVVVQESPPAASQRKRDPIFEALAEVCGIDWQEGLTDTSRGRLNSATSELRKVGATPEDIRRRARRYVQLYPHVVVTPQGLTGNWGQLGEVRPRMATKSEEAAEWVRTQERTPEEAEQARSRIAEIAEAMRARGDLDGE